jgi:hypothetical protein
MLVSAVTPFNASIFPEYIIPNVAHLIRDPEESVRSMYAQCIVPLADTASRYLEMGQALRSHGAFEMPSDTSEADETHFEVRSLYRLLFERLNSWYIGILRCSFSSITDSGAGPSRSFTHGSFQRSQARSFA